MNDQLIIDLMRQQLMPAIGNQDFRFLPATDAAIPNSHQYLTHFILIRFFEWVWCGKSCVSKNKKSSL